MIKKALILIIIFLSTPLMFDVTPSFAQQEKNKTPVTTGEDFYSYSNDTYGFSFNIPKEIKLLTEENPDIAKDLISPLKPIWMYNPDFPDENSHFRVSTLSPKQESEDRAFENLQKELELEEQNFKSTFKQYKRISIKYITIGKHGDKKAIEHLFNMKTNKDVLAKVKHVGFFHKDKFFTFACGTSEERFDTTNKKFFEVIFKSMLFK